MKPVLTMMIGLPRSGKSSWIKEITKSKDIVISNDWIRENILKAPHSKSSNPAIWMITDATLRILLSQGQDVILDGVHATKSERKFFLDLAKECNAAVMYVLVDTPLETCVARNNRSEHHKLPTEDLIRMGKKFERPTKDEYNSIIYVLDNKTASIESGSRSTI